MDAVKLEKRKDRTIKYQALRWLRIEQRCAFIATEVGAFNADVLGVNEKKMIEVEVKISKADLFDDIKKHKHQNYTGKYGTSFDKQWIPTHFYYAVPSELVEDCKKYFEKYSLENYGIIDADAGFSVVKRAGWLHKTEPNSNAKFRLALRMGSELLRFHEAWI